MSKVFFLAFSVLIDGFPTVYMFCNLFHHIPSMISDSFLATYWETLRVMRIQLVTVATEQSETIMHWQLQELTTG